jgi:predicted AAA+ superfamily ATPase
LHEYTRPYIPEFSKLAETDVAFQTGAQYFWNERGHEIDFIVGKELDIGIEVKMKKKVTNKDIKWLLNPPFHLSKKLVIVPYGSEAEVEAKVVYLHSVSNLVI